jgi:hypothetical protein
VPRGRPQSVKDLVAQAGVVANTVAVLANMLHRQLDTDTSDLSEARRQSSVVAGEASRLATLVSRLAPLAELAEDTAAAAKLATRAEASLHAAKTDRADARLATAQLSQAAWSINARIAGAAKKAGPT